MGDVQQSGLRAGVLSLHPLAFRTLQIASQLPGLPESECVSAVAGSLAALVELGLVVHAADRYEVTDNGRQVAGASPFEVTPDLVRVDVGALGW
jgi:hypothetical protein